jgi:endonuclease/exonuclease/phosphatase family metal-dependent hydrolase
VRAPVRKLSIMALLLYACVFVGCGGMEPGEIGGGGFTDEEDFTRTSQAARRHDVELLTWNLHNNAGTSNNGETCRWYARDENIRAVLVKQNPDILALQEDGDLPGLGFAVKDAVASWLSDRYVTSTTAFAGERFGIFVKSSKYTIAESGNIYPAGDARGMRWARINPLDGSLNDFYVINAHFKAHASSADQQQRRDQARKVLEWIHALNRPGRAVFLLGDLNATPGDDAYKILTGAPGHRSSGCGSSCRFLRDTAQQDEDNRTFPNSDPARQIDYVMATDFGIDRQDVTTVNSFRVGGGSACKEGLRMSDHRGFRVKVTVSN